MDVQHTCAKRRVIPATLGCATGNRYMIIIYISGIDGCGKTTQAQLLVETLQKNGHNAVYSWLRWEPSFVKFIKIFRRVKADRHRNLQNKVEDITSAENRSDADWLKLKRKLLSFTTFQKLWLFFATTDYYLAYRKKRNAIKGDILVIDRYYFDFIIDQAVNLGLPPDRCHLIEKTFFLSRFQAPDCSIIIDLPAETGYKRKSDGTPLCYLQTREKYYASLFPTERAFRVDGLLPIPQLSSQITSHVLKFLNNKKGLV